MEIVLNSKLQVPDSRAVSLTAERVAWVLRDLDYAVERRKGKEYRRLPAHFLTGDGIVRTQGFVGFLSAAYSKHLPLAIAPHDLWYITNCELAARVAKDPEKFRDFFTTSKEKQTLVVPVKDPTVMDYTALADMIVKKIPSGRMLETLLIPSLSQMEGMEFAAMCAAFADVVQHYYTYETMCCGIPAVKLRGTKEDFELLRDNAHTLAGLFVIDDELSAYYERVSRRFGEMALSFTQDQTKFWRGIYTQENVGSGGQVDIDGWIRDFFSERPNRLENFDTSISMVPYKNIDTGREFIGVMGAFLGMLGTDGFYQSYYEHVVYEKVQS